MAITKEYIQKMLNQAMQKQKEETQQRLELFVKQKWLENKKYRLSIQNVLFTSLSQMLLTNLEAYLLHLHQATLNHFLQPNVNMNPFHLHPLPNKKWKMHIKSSIF